MTIDIQNTLWKIDCDGYYPYCPNCRYEPDDGRITYFCPNCGKDLRKKNLVSVKTSRQIIKELRLKSKYNRHEELLLSAANKIEELQRRIDDMTNRNGCLENGCKVFKWEGNNVRDLS